MEGTFVQIGVYIVDTIAMLYVGAILFRFMLQVARADFYNPLSQLVVKATNPLLMPLRKVVPGFAGLDIAALVLAFITQIIFIWLLVIIQGGQAGFYGGKIFLWGLLAVGMLMLGIYLISMFIVAIASFIAPHSDNPALSLLRQVIEPVCAPFRRLIPAMGGFDFSFMAVAMTIVILRMLLQGIAHSNGIPL